MESKIARSPVWHVYLVQTAAGMLYTGISTDTARRLKEHESGARGSRILRGKGPLALVFQMEAGTRSSASKLEARIKKLSRKHKLELVSGELHWQTLMLSVVKPDPRL